MKYTMGKIGTRWRWLRVGETLEVGDEFREGWFGFVPAELWRVYTVPSRYLYRRIVKDEGVQR